MFAFDSRSVLPNGLSGSMELQPCERSTSAISGLVDKFESVDADRLQEIPGFLKVSFDRILK